MKNRKRKRTYPVGVLQQYHTTFEAGTGVECVHLRRDVVVQVIDEQKGSLGFGHEVAVVSLRCIHLPERHANRVPGHGEGKPLALFDLKFQEVLHFRDVVDAVALIASSDAGHSHGSLVPSVVVGREGEHEPFLVASVKEQAETFGQIWPFRFLVCLLEHPTSHDVFGDRQVLIDRDGLLQQGIEQSHDIVRK